MGMRYIFTVFLLSCAPFVGYAATEIDLRQTYSQHPDKWPAILTSDERDVPELAPLPIANPTPPPAEVVLGEKLFNDTQLSRNNTVSCATCHEARLAFTDKRRVAVGIDGQTGQRNTPAIFGIDLWQSFFWDGRAETAEQQALMPIVDHKEMDASLPQVLERISADPDYQKLFKATYDGESPITLPNLASAIVAFERTLRPPEGKFEHFITQAYQNPAAALSLLDDDELHGLHLFRTKAKCMTCHNGPLLSDNQFHVTGFHYYQRKHHDIGRYKVTGDPKDSGAFRTPSLWGISKTAPFLHNGLLGGYDFTGLINQYNLGGPRPKPAAHQVDDPLFPETTPLLVKLNLTESEREALAAFLKTL